MPTMRMSILNVDESTVTPLKFRGWLRAEAIDIQRTAQDKDGVIQALDGGLEFAGDGKLYLSGFSVDVQVVD